MFSHLSGFYRASERDVGKPCFHAAVRAGAFAPAAAGFSDFVLGAGK